LGLRRVNYRLLQVGFFNKSIRIYVSRTLFFELTKDVFTELWNKQKNHPTHVGKDLARGYYWLYGGFLYVADRWYKNEEVELLFQDKERREQAKLERLGKFAKAEKAAKDWDSVPQRELIPEDVRAFVWRRDGGRCRRCGSEKNLHFDHIIPISKGGSTIADNLQILCMQCNLAKSNNI
jgi:hypothetical protein